MRDETSVKRYLNQFDKEKIIDLYIQQRFENKQNLWEKSKEIEQKDQRIAELETALKQEQQKHCDICYCTLQKRNEKLEKEDNEQNSRQELRIYRLEQQLATNKLALLKACQELIEQAEEALKKADGK